MFYPIHCRYHSFALQNLYTMNLLIKIVLSVLIGLLGIYPYLQGLNKPGSLDVLAHIGWLPALLVVLLFFTAIAFYCRSLETTLALIKPDNRMASPKSVWLMFVIPYNIIEDFFIMINVSYSLAAEAKTNRQLQRFKDFGLVTGLGWAIAQVMSFIPNEIGQVCGLIGLLLWIKHWILIVKINKALKSGVNS